ncbi:hypothetical protein I4U23_008473 [Adineta vaga]|nr:hypothetical protein I4U23_008473 [Adineta vaga]
MGCTTLKSSKTFFTKTDLIELQKHPEELHEKRIKILKWMEDNIECQIKSNNNYSKIKSKIIQENIQLLYWQEAWEREQQLVQHPSLMDLSNSKISCITLIDENLRLPTDQEVDVFWKNFDKISFSI